MAITIYEYNKCSTCIKALKFLDAQKVKYKKISIVDQPPTLQELKNMLVFIKADGGTIKNLFNTSGVQYRELNMSEKLKNGLTESEALKLLSGHGKLIKRPFLLLNKKGAVGFKENVWKKLISDY
jgi:arsenate reductase (glutaredoxin)